MIKWLKSFFIENKEKKKLKEKAKKYGISLAELANVYAVLGVTVDSHYEQGDELILVKKDGREIVIPIEKMFKINESTSQD